MDSATQTAPVYEQMGASLLSRQPPTSPDQLDRPGSNWDTIFSHLEARLNGLRNWRYSWSQHWRLLAEYFLPRREVWLVSANRMNKGSPINDAIIDSTATQAVKICASGMWKGLVDPSRPWFRLDVGVPWAVLDADGKAWLEDTQERVYTILAQSNFYSVMAQAFEDVTVFGTAPVIIYEDFEDVIRCYLPCAGEYFLASGARFDVDTLYREFNLTIAQIIEMFGVENCPQQVTQLWRTGGASLETEMVVAHAIEPNFAIAARGAMRSEIAVVPGTFTFRELYWLKGVKTPVPLSKRGFHSKPFITARWSTVSNDAYGRSPCMDALGDTKQVQLETRRKAEFIEKGVRPPMGANPELRNEPSSIIPGMITYVNTDGGKKGFFPLFEPDHGWLLPLVNDIEKVSQRINAALFVDVFMAITRMEGVQPRNELELTKRDLERLQVLGPFVQLFETEAAGPAIRRVLDVLQRRKMLAPMPASLRGVPLKIDYVSIMKLAQKSSESVAMKDVFATMGELSSAAKAAGVPDPIRVFNLDKSARKYADLNNYPADCIFTDDEVKAHDQVRHDEMQKAQAPAQAMAGVTAAKTLSETSLSGGSALGALMGAPAGQ